MRRVVVRPCASLTVAAGHEPVFSEPGQHPGPQLNACLRTEVAHVADLLHLQFARREVDPINGGAGVAFEEGVARTRWRPQVVSADGGRDGDAHIGKTVGDGAGVRIVKK